MTPQVQAGISNGDGAFALFGSPPFCTSAIKALTTVGFKGPVTAIEQCVDQTSAKATNGGYKGVNVLTSRNSTNKEYAQYLAVMRKYAKGVDTGGVAPGGYTAVLALVRALPNLTGDVTAQTISAGMAAAPRRRSRSVAASCSSATGSRSASRRRSARLRSSRPSSRRRRSRWASRCSTRRVS